MTYQPAPAVMMVRPAVALSNPSTAASNSFQKQLGNLSHSELLTKSQAEFDLFVQTLRDNEVNVLVIEDKAEPQKPDAVFPNNWISFHPGGLIITYPMLAENRRCERRPEIIRQLSESGFHISRHWNITEYEKDEEFLEGTGSIVFDYDHKLAYANISPRTNFRLLDLVCSELGFKPIKFKAVDGKGKDIYHTNVVMGIGDRFATVCLDCITEGRDLVAGSLEETGHFVIDINYQQMNNFAGNLLQLQTGKKEKVTALSATAWDSLGKKQRMDLSRFGKVLPISIPTIETLGGGSVRCMLAGIHF